MVFRKHFLSVFFLLPMPLMAQSVVEVAKVYNYRQPITPVGADSYQYSTLYYNARKAYNMKGFVMRNCPYNIFSLKYSPAGNNYALLYRNEKKGSVDIMDAWTVSTVLRKLVGTSLPTAISYSADSRRFFVANEASQIEVYETHAFIRQGLWTISQPAELLTASSNDFFLAAVNKTTIWIINQETGDIRTTLQLSATVNDVAFSEGSDMMGALTDDGELHVYETRTFQQVFESSGLGKALSLSFHPDGKYVGVLTGSKSMVFLNLTDPNDRAELYDEDGDMTYLRFLKDEKQQVYLSYNTTKTVRYKQLKGFAPNLNKMLSTELAARMNEWALMRPDETIEDYQSRVNEESRIRQTRLFEQEIATELALDQHLSTDVKLGGYQQESGTLTLTFADMPQIYLSVPSEELASFQDTNDLEFRDAVYGLTKEDKFEMLYAMVYNKSTGKSYEFNNLERQSLDFLRSDENFVPIELVQQTGIADLKLQAIKNDVVETARKKKLISDHTQIKINSSVAQDIDASGNKVNNYQVNFNYTVEGSYSIREDFPAGKYRIEDSHAAVSMLNIISRAFNEDFAQYIKPDKRVLVKITGTADALKINSGIAYDGCYGEFIDEPYRLDHQLNTITVSRQTGIQKNEQLAFMRAVGVKDYIEKHISSLQTMQTDYQYHIELSKGTGGMYRRINIEFVFVDAFENP